MFTTELLIMPVKQRQEKKGWSCNPVSMKCREDVILRILQRLGERLRMNQIKLLTSEHLTQSCCLQLVQQTALFWQVFNLNIQMLLFHYYYYSAIIISFSNINTKSMSMDLVLMNHISDAALMLLVHTVKCKSINLYFCKYLAYIL